MYGQDSQYYESPSSPCMKYTTNTHILKNTGLFSSSEWD